MAFTPFFQGTDAQSVINNYLGSGSTATTPMPLQDMNANNVFRNPYSPDGFYANDTDVNPKPAFTPPVADENGNPVCDNANGYFYDPVTQSCILAESEQETTNESSGGNQTQPIYQGVGSIASPTQNAFMNLGLGAEGLTAKTAKSYFDSGEIDPYGTGLSGMFRRFTPMGQLSTAFDVNRLVNSGVLDRASDGTLTFAKGGNLNLVKANQAFEQDLARKQGLNLDAQADTPYAVDSSGSPIYMQQSRGDKADDMGNVYKGLKVSQSPNQSQFGGGNKISYTGSGRGDTTGGQAQKMFEAKQRFGPTKVYNTDKFKGLGFTGGR